MHLMIRDEVVVMMVMYVDDSFCLGVSALEVRSWSLHSMACARQNTWDNSVHLLGVIARISPLL